MIDGWTAGDVARVVRAPGADDDKYSRGVVGIRTGSATYPGAAVLGVEAAWRTGVGMVRYVGSASEAVLARRPETVTAAGRVQAWVIGSGTDAAPRPESETTALRDILAGESPVVVDAGALDLAVDAAAPVIVTPHDREHARLREACGLDPRVDDRVKAAVETARALGVVVLLKGARTVIADADGATRRLMVDVPWLATAGTGDVLAGVLGALTAASDADPTEIAASAVWVHARAGEIAACAHGPSGGPITALDVAEHLPRAVGEVLALQR
ncbi:NAD(P)H-hydrate dehydratase [Microbacterium koreense]|uniref:ADP-dependent (S)-NAD(P)H-hydrate dehydratase n=1 Tax=Microbacterium koreense TaxID=323761 RepID=A0ABW2ZTN6_9MICO